MRIPEFIKEVVWSVYPPRYKQIADKNFKQSLGYMSKLLVLALIIAGLLFIPKIATLTGTVQNELAKFESFHLEGNVTQSAPITIPRHNPWVIIDLNSERKLTNEILVIDQSNVQYRFLKINSIPRDHLKDANQHRMPVGGFVAKLIMLMIPGIILFLYVRTWLKYLLLIIVGGTLFFIIMELTKFRLKWKQMLNIAAHALTLVIFIEVISAAIATGYLVPIFRFLGVNIYAITSAIFFGLMIVGILGYHIGARKRR